MATAKIKIGDSFKEIYTNDFLKRMEDENKIFNLEHKNMEEHKKYVDKVLDVNLLKNNNKNYLSLGVIKLTELIKISKKTVFELIKNRELDSVKIGKYRLVIFCIEDYYERPVSEVKKMLEYPSMGNEYRLACDFERSSILKAILSKYEHNLLR